MVSSVMAVAPAAIQPEKGLRLLDNPMPRVAARVNPIALPIPLVRTTRPSRPTRDEMPEKMEILSMLRRDLPAVPLLTAEQEWALGRRRRGEAVRVPAPGKPYPTPAEACNRLIEQNIGLVLTIVRKYRWPGVAVEDLVQEGIMGLREAADRFDPDLGCRFSTYAFWWIHQAMRRSIVEASNVIHIPSNIRAQTRQISRTEEDLTRQFGRAPTRLEVAKELGLTLDQLDEAHQTSRQPVSLDQAITDGEHETYADRLRDPGPPPEAAEEHRSLANEIRRVLTFLEPREREVICLRYGIGVDRMHTPEETAAIAGITRQAVSRIEERALGRLRAHRQSRQLRSFL